MRTAKVFLIGMYMHLLLIIAIPAGILMSSQESGWNMAGSGLLIVYLLAAVVVQALGWGMVGMTIFAYSQREYEKIRRGWKQLKLGSIPFYIVNFIYGCIIWLGLIGDSREVMIFLFPVPVLVTCLIIMQSGCVGVCYIRYLCKLPENKGRLHGVHYVLQLLPVLDVISTLVILKKYAGKMGN